jgi:CRP-like cAMP-binding protein
MKRPENDHFPELPYLGEGAQFADRIAVILDRIELFDGFEQSDVTAMAQFLHCYRAPPGAPIIREGDEGDYLVLVLSGIVEITKRDESGSGAPLSTVGPGKTLGEMSLIDGEPRFASCIALEDTEFAVLDREGLSRIISEQPQLGIKILIEMVQLLSQRLRSATVKLADHPEV